MINIDLNDYLNVDEAIELNRLGYPVQGSTYYWYFSIDLIKNEPAKLVTKEFVLKRHGGEYWRCVAAPSKEEAVFWRLQN